MITPDWDILQFKYEVLGVPLPTLAAEYDIDLALLDYHAKEWTPNPISLEKLENFSSLPIDEIIDKLSSTTLSQSKIFSLLKQRQLAPQFIELETLILKRATEVVYNLDAENPKASNVLANITDVLTDLLSNNPALKSKESEAGSAGSERKWEITIVDAASGETVEPTETTDT